jgi:hypothetical protein
MPLTTASSTSRRQALEALAGLRKFGRNPRRSWMHLGADMVGDETHDALAVFCR